VAEAAGSWSRDLRVIEIESIVVLAHGPAVLGGFADIASRIAARGGRR
jgi:hypothetical protein